MTDTPLLIIFARALQAGQVKTRLIANFGAEGAMQIYKQLLWRTFSAAQEFPGDVQLWLDKPDAALKAEATVRGWSCHLQSDGDLGERMARALSHGLGHFSRVLLIGSDCLLLGRPYFEQALHTLAHAPVVFGASEDGGYVLLGSSQASLWSAARFNGVRFGGHHALQDSCACFASEQIVVLPPLWDVDEASDVARARSSGLLPPVACPELVGARKGWT